MGPLLRSQMIYFLPKGKKERENVGFAGKHHLTSSQLPGPHETDTNATNQINGVYRMEKGLRGPICGPGLTGMFSILLRVESEVERGHEDDALGGEKQFWHADYYVVVRDFGAAVDVGAEDAEDEL